MAFARFIAVNEVTFQRAKTSKESNDPDRDAKLDCIETAINTWPDRCFAFDEFGPLTIGPVVGSCWSPASKPQRSPAAYHKRHGVGQFYGCYSIDEDTLWGVVRNRKSRGQCFRRAQDGPRCLARGQEDLRDSHNLSARKGVKIRIWAGRNHVELCFAPIYSS